MKILNFIAAYSIDEDRILLEIRGKTENHTCRLTRRAIAILEAATNQIFKIQCEIASSAAQIQSFSHELAEFDQTIASEKHQISDLEGPLSLNGNGWLVYEIGHQVISDSLCTIKLSSRKNQGFQYQLNRHVLHALINLLNEQLRKAQ